MAALHQKLAVAVVLAALFGTLWSLYRAYLGSTTRRLLTVSWAMVALTVLEGALGTALGVSGGRPSSASHFIVGPITLVPLPVALLLSTRLRERSAAIVLAVAWLTTIGLALRATGTGGLAA